MRFHEFPVRSSRPILAAALAVGALSSESRAQSDAWHWSLTPYVWAADVGIDVELAGRQVVSETIPVEDLLEDVEATFQGRLEAQRGELGLLVDVFYVSIADSASDVALPQGAGTAGIDYSSDLAVIDLAATFDPGADGRGFSFLGGLRVLEQSADVDADFSTTSGANHESYAASDTLVDALAGVRARFELAAGLTFETQLDASTGGTEFTWSAFPALRWALPDSSLSLLAGWRHLEASLREDGDVASALTLSGPVIGLSISL